MVSHLAQNMFKVGTIFYHISGGWDDVLALGNLSQERDTCKWISKAMEFRRSNLQKELIALQGEVKAAKSLKKGADIHNLPFVLATRVTQIEGSLRNAERWYKDASDYVKDNTCQVKEHQKALLQKFKVDVEALASLQNKLANMNHAFSDSFRQIIQDVLRACERVVEQARKRFPNVVISTKVLDPFKSTSEVALGGGPVSSAPYTST